MKNPIKRIEKTTQTGRKYLQTTTLTKDLNLEYIKNSKTQQEKKNKKDKNLIRKWEKNEETFH